MSSASLTIEKVDNIPPAQITGELTIQNSFIALNFIEISDSNEAIFNFTDYDGTAQQLAFSLKYYTPSNGTCHGLDCDDTPSGAYIFLPETPKLNKTDYSKFKRIEASHSELVSSLILYFDNDEG